MTYTKWHEIDENPETNAHLAEIVESIKTNGWVGLPLLADEEYLFNGCHRATACEILGIDPQVHNMQITANWDDHYYLLFDLSNARRTDEVLRALKALRALNLVDQLSVDIMQAEDDKE